MWATLVWATRAVNAHVSGRSTSRWAMLTVGSGKSVAQLHAGQCYGGSICRKPTAAKSGLLADDSSKRDANFAANALRGRTLIEPPGRPFVLPGAKLRNQMPRTSQSGRLSQCRISALRDGNAASKTAAKRETAFRAHVASGRTSRLPTNTGFHPSSRASAGASRRFRSIFESRSCRSATRVLTSTQTNARQIGCHAKMSIDPTSPWMPKVCSGNARQPAAVSRPTTSRTITACFSSSRLASSAPRQRGAKGKETPTTAATRRTNRSDVSSKRPFSIVETTAWLTAAAAATSACRWPRLIRTALMTEPTRVSSTLQRMNRVDCQTLIWRSTDGEAGSRPRRAEGAGGVGRGGGSRGERSRQATGRGERSRRATGRCERVRGASGSAGRAVGARGPRGERVAGRAVRGASGGQLGR